MKKINVCIIGAGNISNTRHIPALKKLKNVNIVGVISDSEKKIKRTLKNLKTSNTLIIKNPKNDKNQLLKCEWFKKVDAVIVGTPPRDHYPLVKLALEMNKHVLVEKPMTMNVKEADELISLSKRNKKILSVIHNFQYAKNMKKLNQIIETKKYGEIQSITETQFTNRDRRLPSWYKDLPLGLFYDEAAHFIYLLQRHAGKVNVINSTAIYSENLKDNTPIILNCTLVAGKIPVTMSLNFNSAICEWSYIVNFKKRICIYDLFLDILVDIPSDNEHYAKDILKKSLFKSLKFWKGFVLSGFHMIFGNLLYGQEEIMKNFISSVDTGVINKNHDSIIGRETIRVMNEIVEKVNKR